MYQWSCGFGEAEQNIWIIDLCEIISPGEGSESIYQAIHLWFCNLCHETTVQGRHSPAREQNWTFNKARPVTRHIFTFNNLIQLNIYQVEFCCPLSTFISEITGHECVLIIPVGWQARFKWAIQMLSSWMRKMCWIEPHGQLAVVKLQA